MDERGNVIRREDPVDDHSTAYYSSSDVTEWDYNARNQVILMTDALGHTTRYQYDALDLFEVFYELQL